MARPWVHMYWLDHETTADGRDILPVVWTTGVMRYPLRDREYRLTFDPAMGRWAVYVRMGGRVSPAEHDLAPDPGDG